MISLGYNFDGETPFTMHPPMHLMLARLVGGLIRRSLLIQHDIQKYWSCIGRDNILGQYYVMVGAAIKFLRENCEATDNQQVVGDLPKIFRTQFYRALYENGLQT